MSQFLAEAVSVAVVEAAHELGVSGTVHIAEPDGMGLTSTGFAADGSMLWP